jgi:EmrB/QacA subfamily drug resistance transporter
MAAAVLGTALAYMSDDMLNLAVPSLARDLGATVTDVQWVLNAYYVALVSSVLVAGSIGDVVGHRRVFQSGIVVFSLGAVGCAVAPSIWPLVISRFVQGLGAAMLLAAGLALVTRSAPPEGRSRTVGQFLGLVAAVPALGPFASGVLVDLLSWRWLFVAPLVLPMAALTLARLFVAETPHDPSRRPDLLGSVLAFATLCGVSVALIVGAAEPLRPVPVTAFCVSLVLGTAFVWVERRQPDPLLPLGLLRRRVFAAGNLIWLAAGLTCWGAVFFTAVTLQTTLGQRPLIAGLVLTPIYLVMMVGSPLAGRLADRIGPRGPIVGGLSLYATGLLLLSRIGPGSSLIADVLPGILLFAAGMALFTAPLAAATLGALGEDEQGIASGMNNATGQLAGLLAVAILPAAAGLAGVGFGEAAFAAGFERAMHVTAGVAIACIPLAAWTFARRRVGPSVLGRRIGLTGTCGGQRRAGRWNRTDLRRSEMR